VTPRLAEWLSAPLVPVNASVKVPVDDDPVDVTDTVDVAGIPAEGVTGLVTATLTPVGAVPTHE
jgi:hypothetical protein